VSDGPGARAGARGPARDYPERPILGVGAVIVDGDAVVLVRRKYEPLAGQWSLPGGAVEAGETLVEAVRREVLEETGLDVHVGPLVALVDRIDRDEAGRVRHHFVIADYLCRPADGALRAGSDATEVALVREADLDAHGVTPAAAEVVKRGLRMARDPDLGR
jgi:ADP-ribose pyrophosphatase YjhB (NUDIX family)